MRSLCFSSGFSLVPPTQTDGFHQKCGRTGIQRQFRSSSERHRQRLVPWALPPEGEQNRLLLRFVPSRGDAVRNFVPVSIDRGGSRRVYDRGPLLSDVRELGDAPCRCLARLGGSARRCRRPDARYSAAGNEGYAGDKVVELHVADDEVGVDGGGGWGAGRAGGRTAQRGTGDQASDTRAPSLANTAQPAPGGLNRGPAAHRLVTARNSCR